MIKVQRRVQALLALGALGAAGMFLGAEGPWGLDFGSIGATLLYAAWWVLVVYVARHAGEVFPEEWSPAEKQAWVAVVFVALIGFCVIDVLTVLPDLAAEADRMRNAATRGLWTRIGMLIFAWIVIARLVRKQDAASIGLDERDLRIAHAAARFADGAMTSLVIWLVVALVAMPEHSRTWLRPVIAANVLIALLIARALVENIYTVLRYRRER